MLSVPDGELTEAIPKAPDTNTSCPILMYEPTLRVPWMVIDPDPVAMAAVNVPSSYESRVFASALLSSSILTPPPAPVSVRVFDAYVAVDSTAAVDELWNVTTPSAVEPEKATPVTAAVVCVVASENLMPPLSNSTRLFVRSMIIGRISPVSPVMPSLICAIR